MENGENRLMQRRATLIMKRQRNVIGRCYLDQPAEGGMPFAKMRAQSHYEYRDVGDDILGVSSRA